MCQLCIQLKSPGLFGFLFAYMDREEQDTSSCDKKRAEEVIREMEEASEKDRDLNSEGKPALHKLLLIDEVYNKLLNKKVHEELLDVGLLSALRKWLEPLPDNSLPDEETKKKVLGILLHLEPSKEHLVESRIGRIVLFYSKNPYELRPIKQIARQLVLKWIDIGTQAEDQ